MKTKTNNKRGVNKNLDKDEIEFQRLCNDPFVKDCARTLAYDLLRYSRNGGDMTNITATKVYDFLHELDKKGQL